MEFSDTGWDEVTKSDVDQFISANPVKKAMPHWHSPEGDQLDLIRQLAEWATIPEEPDGEDMHKMLRQAVEMIGQLRVKLDTGNLTRAQDEGYDQGI